MPLDHEPGTVSAYHFLTQHWVSAELVRRLDGRPYGDYLRAEITGPLGLVDTYVGLPVELEDRLAKLHVTDGTDEWGLESVRALRDVPVHRMIVPGASGVSTARDMARFYAAIAAGGVLDGARILRRETVDRLLAIEVDGEIDATFDVPVRRGLGFELGGQDDAQTPMGGGYQHRAHVLARRFRLLGLLGRPRPRPGDGLPDQRRPPRRSRRHRPPQPLRRRARQQPIAGPHDRLAGAGLDGLPPPCRRHGCAR